MRLGRLSRSASEALLVWGAYMRLLCKQIARHYSMCGRENSDDLREGKLKLNIERKDGLILAQGGSAALLTRATCDSHREGDYWSIAKSLLPEASVTSLLLLGSSRLANSSTQFVPSSKTNLGIL